MLRNSQSYTSYIAGPGRSGSTLLDITLGQADGFVSVGELRNIWARGFGEDWPCGCGLPVRRCPFWSAVLETAFGSAESVSVEAMRELQGGTVRTRHLPRLWWACEHGGTASVASYADVLSRLYRAIGLSGRSPVLVSSSTPQSTRAMHSWRPR
jgi:hypothetical protein